ncbi:hypothetical protein ABVT39_011025 [Epinephelus coioides]
MVSVQRWPEKCWALLQLLLVASGTQAEKPVCRRRGDPENPQLSNDGDIFLGGIFSFHRSWKTRQDNYMHKPLPLQCISLNFREIQFAQAMLFAIVEINNRTDLLPGVSLGYKIYDSCRSMARAVRVTLALTNGNEVLSAPSKAPCARPAQVQAIIGETSSSPSMAIATVIGSFHIPVISPFATCACLSDKTKYPSFLRTIPSDDYQSRALAQLVKHFGWTWVGAIRTNDDYGNNGMATFTETAQQLGICLEYSVSFFRTDPPDKIQKIIDIIKASTSKVIVTFLAFADINMLIHEMSHYNFTRYQWVGSESWIFDPQTAAIDKHHILDGAIGLSIPKAHVSGMREFILDVKPLNSSSNELFTEFWETLFSCKLKQSKSSSAENQRECTGHEDLTGVQNSFTDMSLMPILNNIYKGVYAVAHALHSILSCNKTCNMKVQLDPYTILQHIKRIHFKTKEGEEVYFNENGDPAAKYEIINWQPTENGIVDFVTVGFYDASLPADKQLNLQNKSLIWANTSQQQLENQTGQLHAQATATAMHQVSYTEEIYFDFNIYVEVRKATKQISPFATCACLSDKTKYPSFLRTIPSDDYQSRALAQLVKHFGWTWVGAIRTNDDYGNNGMATFTETAQQLGICLEYSVSFFRTDPPDKIQKIIDIIRASTSKVIVTFLALADIDMLIHEMSHYNLTRYQWVGSESWIFDPETAAIDKHHILDGAIGLSIPKAHVSGMREFMLDVKPLNSSGNELFTEFWETLFSCKFKQSKSSAENQRECTGHEDLTGVQNSFTDMSLMPILNNIYKGVYAVAHALHSILSCNKTCNMKVQLDPYTILQHIKMIHFKTKEGEEVYFNENGDPAAKYEIINWQPTENGIVDFVTVGFYDASLPADKQLNLQNKSLIWANNSQQKLEDQTGQLHAQATATAMHQISHFATCACLSDKTKYPSFLRTIPSDDYQSRALAQLVKHFGWTWVGAIRTNDDYGNNGMATFTETAQQLGICLEYSVSFFRTDPPDKIKKIIDIIRASTSKVIVTFLALADIDMLIREMSHYNLTRYQWVGSESWIFDPETAAIDKHHILDGAIGLSIPKAHVSGMREFMLDVKPLNSSGNELFTEFWETLFSCKFKQSKSSTENQRECTGHEDLTGVQNSFTDMSLMPILNNIYKGVYAVAHALHSILTCNKTCNMKVQLDPYTILQHIQMIHFKTKEGEEVYFNENGDPAAKYEIINWQPTENGIVDFVTVGFYDASLPADKQLNLQNKSFIWANNSQQEMYHEGAPTADFTPAEELALDQNRGRPMVEGIQRGTASDSVPPTETALFIQVSGDTLTLLEPPEDDPGEGTSAAVDAADEEETLYLDSRRFEKLENQTGQLHAQATATAMHQISHFATCACLSDKTKYPSFLRTIPSDAYQSRALAQLVKHFGWTWVGAIRTNDDYGNNGMATFTETAQQLGICLEYSVSFFRTDPPDKIQKLIDIIKASTSKVIVAFLSPADIPILIHPLSHHNLTEYQWVGSEGWIFDPQTAAMDKHHILDGAIGLSIPKAHVSGMREFMLDVKPLNSSSNEVFTEFWETLFSCKFQQSKSSAENQRECTGHEDLTGVQNSFTDMSLMPIFNNVYKGVYAVAHALHSMLSCNKTCYSEVPLDPYTILQNMKRIHFKTKEGEEVYFNENGDPAAKYEIINWQPTENGIVDFVTVGFYDASLPADKQLNLQNKSLIWANNSQQLKSDSD